MFLSGTASPRSPEDSEDVSSSLAVTDLRSKLKESAISTTNNNISNTNNNNNNNTAEHPAGGQTTTDDTTGSQESD